MTTILIFAYYSYKDPVFQSAVLPYFTNFPNRENYNFILITFEQRQYFFSPEEKSGITEFLRSQNIFWYQRNWHSGKFKMVKKIFDFLQSIVVSLKLVARHKVNIIYSEGFPGAILSHFISKVSRLPHVVHTFEPHADYMLESGVWNTSSWEYRFLKRMEMVVAKNAVAILTATQLMIETLTKSGVKALTLRVPSCVDLHLFQFSDIARMKIRHELHIEENEKLLVYLGKFGGMYWDVELFKMFDSFEKHGTLSYKYLIISTEEEERILAFNEHSYLKKKLLIKKLGREDVPKYLSASDGAICGIKNIPSRRFSSPIKNGEYWACGLPVIIPYGISDDYLFAEENDIGIVLKECYSEKALQKAVHDYESKVNSESWSDIRQRAATFVNIDRNVDMYKKKLNELFRSIKYQQ